MKKYNKHFLKRDPSSQVVLVEDGKPVLDEVAKTDIPLEDWHIRALNKSWKKTGIYYAPMEEVKVKPQKSKERLTKEKEAKELGIKSAHLLSDEKLEEKINKAIEE